MISSLVVALVALGLLNGWMLLQQPGMIFFPYRDLAAAPSDWGYAYEDVFVTTDDRVRLHGWYIPHPQAQRVVLFFHGNAGNISHRGDSVAIFQRLGLNVFIFDYRGYGRSEGSPSEQGLYRDAAAAWRYLTETRGFDAREIVLFGRSLGGAVAAQLAAVQQPGALILESTLSSARDFARSVFPLLSRLGGGAVLRLAARVGELAGRAVAAVAFGLLGAITIVVADASSAANPRLGVSCVIFLPTVEITRMPYVARPITIPPPPSMSTL